MIRSTQRKCSGSSYKQDKIQKEDDKQPENQKVTLRNKQPRELEDDTPEGSSTDIDCDQDSDVSFGKDSDKEIDTAELEQEDWIEYIKRSTAVTKEKLNTAKIPRCIEMHRRMKWKLAMRMGIATKRTMGKKTTEWNASEYNTSDDPQGVKKNLSNINIARAHLHRHPSSTMQCSCRRSPFCLTTASSPLLYELKRKE